MAQMSCRSLFQEALSEPVQTTLQERYNVSSDQVQLTPNSRFPVIFRMADHKTLTPEIPVNSIPVRELKTYDVVIAGGGPAGLTSALYLAEAGKSVLILERNSELGGLGAGSELKGVRAGGGAAYSAGPEGGLEYKIFQKIGLGKYKKKISIKEPIDSYLWNGKLYKGIWEDHTLHELPASFALFKHALLKLSKQGAGQESGPLAEWADGMFMSDLVKRMPTLAAEWKDAKSKEIMKIFNNDTRVSKTDPMGDVLELLDLYGRSALGGPTNMISARQFVDFYVSEIYTRYTGTLGTGTVTEALIKKLKKYPNLVHFKTSAPVAAIENTADGAMTSFIEGNVLKEVRAKKVIFAAPVTLAPKIVKGLEAADPQKLAAISGIQMSDYAVHVVRVKGHPFRATYDTWVANNGDPSKPTDYILGRWQDPLVNAYEGMRNFERNPVDDYGVITIYQPLGLANRNNFQTANNLKMVENAVNEMVSKLTPIVARDQQKIEIELVESYRWPYSIHIVDPGFLKKIPILARPTKNVHYANNTIQSPELETAMARGAREAMQIIELLNNQNLNEAAGY